MKSHKIGQKKGFRFPSLKEYTNHVPKGGLLNPGLRKGLGSKLARKK